MNKEFLHFGVTKQEYICLKFIVTSFCCFIVAIVLMSVTPSKAYAGRSADKEISVEYGDVWNLYFEISSQYHSIGSEAKRIHIAEYPSTDGSRHQSEYVLTLFEETSNPDNEKLLYLHSIGILVDQARPLQFQLISGSIYIGNRTNDEKRELSDQVFSSQGYFPTDEEWQFFYEAIDHGYVYLQARVVDRQSYSYNMELSLYDYKDIQTDMPSTDSIFEQRNEAGGLNSEPLTITRDDIILIQLNTINNGKLRIERIHLNVKLPNGFQIIPGTVTQAWYDEGLPMEEERINRDVYARNLEDITNSGMDIYYLRGDDELSICFLVKVVSNVELVNQEFILSSSWTDFSGIAYESESSVALGGDYLQVLINQMIGDAWPERIRLIIPVIALIVSIIALFRNNKKREQKAA